MLFTALTLCAGFKGGRSYRHCLSGRHLASFMSTILAAPTDICAACGMVGVFCAVTNSPITSLLIAAELFGFNGMPFYCIVVAVGYLLSGYYSLYKEQKIVYSKTENKYVDKHTK
ncbi:MAG: chloride channel protein [Coprococcus sp.]